jgi:hypothetical protein
MPRNRSNGGLGLPDIDPSVALAQAMHNEGKHRAVFRQKRETDAPSLETGSIGARTAAGGMRNRALMLLKLRVGSLENSFATTSS